MAAVLVTSCGDNITEFDDCAGIPEPEMVIEIGDSSALGPLDIALAIDAEHIYWVELREGRVRRVEKSGGSPITLAMLANPSRLVLDETSIYVLAIGDQNTRSIYMLSKSGGAAQDLSGSGSVACSLSGCGSALALDDTAVYWDLGDRIMHVPKNGGGAAPLYVLRTWTRDIIVDQDRVYWKSLAPLGSPVPGTNVQAGPKSIGPITTLAVVDPTTIGLPRPMTADDQNLYPVGYGGIWRISKDGRSEEHILAMDIDAHDVATDGVNVYVSTESQIVRVPRRGGEVSAIACSCSPRRLAVDDSRVYWIDLQFDEFPYRLVRAAIMSAPK